MSTRIIAHIDMDAFFASIESQRHPEWKGQPIIVCVFSGRTEDSGVVSSASYVARQAGVRAAMPIAQAKQKVPNGHFVPVDHAYYSHVSETVFLRLFPLSDILEIASIDEAYIDLTKKTSGSFEKAEQILRDFQTKLSSEMGLSCSIGLSSNKLVAKIASDFQKPNGFTIVKPEMIQSFLDPLPVKRLLGVGPKTEEQLHELGVQTIADLRLASLNDLVRLLGEARGNLFFTSSRGVDESSVESDRERKQHSKIWTLTSDASTFEEIFPSIGERVEELWNETAAKGQFFTQVGVIGISIRLKSFSKSKTLNVPLATREQFANEINELFQLLLDSAELPLRRVGIRVGGFAAPPKQKRLGDFFSG